MSIKHWKKNTQHLRRESKALRVKWTTFEHPGMIVCSVRELSTGFSLQEPSSSFRRGAKQGANVDTVK